MNAKKRYLDIILSLVIVIFLYITTLNLTFFESIDWVQANDVYSYLKISLAYPHFPKEQIASHFAYRFLPHYFVGFLASLLSIEIGTSYSIVNFLFSVGIVFFSLRTLYAFHLESKISLLFAFIFFVSPFVLRLNIFSPGLLADTVHIFGLVVCLHAIGIKNITWLLLGIFFASIGKQFIILEMPGLLILFFSAVRDEKSKFEIGICMMIIMVYMLTIYSALNYFGSSFADSNTISFKTFFSFFFWITSANFSFRLLFEHIFRLMLPLFPFLLMLFGFRKHLIPKNVLSVRNVGLLFVLLAPMAYGFLPGPEVQMGNQSRYSSVGLLAFVLLLLNCITELEFDWDLRLITISFSYMLLHTYHHKYTIFNSVQILTLVTQLFSYVILYFIIHLILVSKKCSAKSAS